ncbi:MAG: M3 family oligoendopeptidase, partial [Bacillota bacterium]
MTFKDYKYERPDMERLKQDFNASLEAFKGASDKDDALKAVKAINKIRMDFNTMATLSNIRHTIDTNDAFYNKEKDFFDQNSPVMSELINNYYRALLESPFKEGLKDDLGALLFSKAKTALKTFDPKIMPLLRKENELRSKHQKITAGIEVPFKDETYNLSQMAVFRTDRDRAVRKAASKATENVLLTKEEELDRLYDELVEVRTRIAHELGFDNFIELAYARLGRTDWDAGDVEGYRRQIKDVVVPLNQKLTERKRKRLGLDTLYHYDLALDYMGGNAKPKGDKDYLVKEAKAMYEAMSPETSEFFNFMLDRDLMDLKTKKGKAGGGYCTIIPNHQSPFIFSNFNGTKHDVDVLTHEAGHAFQMYMSSHHTVPEYMMAGFEISEIHSMSMEFFAWPHINRFFGNDETKYKFSHLNQALMLLSYGASIDEFQHAIYENPTMSIQERKTLWRSIEKTY